MNHDGSLFDNKQQIFAPLWCIICIQHVGCVRKYSGIVGISSLAEPRGSAHMASFSSSESVIVGNTLPTEVSVSRRRL